MTPDPAAFEERDPLDLLAEQFLQQVRGGEAVTPESFADRHPEHAAALRDLLPTLLLLEQARRDRESSTGSGRRIAIPQLERLGDFRIVREVGRGGMGVVFEAVQESLGRRVALKVLPQASLLSGNQLERFRREARTAAQLHHTHIVPVFDSGEADGFHYYAMQFIDGRGLDAVVRELRRERPEGDSTITRDQCRRSARLCAAVADALHHAHLQGTLHRDVKPANLLVDAEDHVWVTDFGLAKALQQEGLTHSGDVLGTLQYMAPEQFDGQYDARSEVYALGATLYELLALRPAFAGRTRSEVIDRIRAGRCERLRRLQPAVSHDLETIVAKAMAVLPQQRYPTADALAQDLRAWLEDRPIAARRQTALAQFGWWCRRNRGLATASGVAIAAVLGAAVVGWVSWWATDAALDLANRRGQAAKEATERAEGNLRDTLAVMADVFDTVVGPDPLHTRIEDLDGESAAVAAQLPPVDDQDIALLGRLLAFYDDFAVRNQDSPTLREQAARAYGRVGAIQARFGDLDAAAAAYREALDRSYEFDARGTARDRAGLQQELGQVLLRGGDARGAALAFAESLKLLRSAEGEPSRSARWLEARAHYLLATVHRFREGPNEPGRGGRRDGFGMGPGRGRPGADGPRERPPRPPGDREPDRQEPRQRQGQKPMRPGDRRAETRPRDGLGPGWIPLQRRLAAEAKGHLDAAVALIDGLLRQQPDDAEVLFLQARCLLAQDALPRGGHEPGGGPPDERPPEDRPAAGPPSDVGTQDARRRDAARLLLEQLVAAHPEQDDYRYELCATLLPDRRPAGPLALDDFAAALRHAEVLVAHQPRHAEFQALLARCLTAMGVARHDREGAGPERPGVAELERAVEIQRQLIRPADGEALDLPFLRDALLTLRQLVRVRLANDDREGARDGARELVQLLLRAKATGTRGMGPGGRELLPLLERLGLREQMELLRDAERRPR
ncbi:MAG: protein kinase [Planctomycetota bacterium]